MAAVIPSSKAALPVANEINYIKNVLQSSLISAIVTGKAAIFQTSPLHSTLLGNLLRSRLTLSTTLWQRDVSQLHCISAPQSMPSQQSPREPGLCLGLDIGRVKPGVGDNG